MASLKNTDKAFQRVHRERHQPASRAHVGYLEKKKDYQARANDFNKKQNAIKLLRKKALDKNPDEFYFHMINSELRDGRHFEKPRKGHDLTPDQVKLMQSQDSKYIGMKRSVELKKIAKLRSSLHLLDVEGLPKNRHILFTETREEAKNMDLSKRLESRPDLLSRVYNVPSLESLRSKKLVRVTDEKTVAVVAKEREKAYRELLKRMERERQLRILSEKMDLKAKLMKKKDNKPVKVKEGTTTSAPLYKWPKERKR